MRIAATLLAAALGLAAANGAAQVLPAGDFKARDGRPGPGKVWHLSDERGQQIAAELNAIASKTPIVIDYDHQTLYAPYTGARAEAAGWMQGFEWRQAEGLFAKVEWTADAQGQINSGKYRYISPVITFDEDTGDVTGVAMAALVNLPAIVGMEAAQAATVALAAWSKSLGRVAPAEPDLANKPKEPQVDLIVALCTLLGLASGSDQTAVLAAVQALKDKAAAPASLPVALSTALGVSATADEAAVLSALEKFRVTDPLAIKTIAALHAQVVELQAKVQNDDVQLVIEKAIEDGKLFPSLAQWALDTGRNDRATLSAYIAAAPVMHLKGQSGGKPPGGAENAGTAALATDPVALGVAAQMGIKPEAWAAAAKATTAAA